MWPVPSRRARYFPGWPPANPVPSPGNPIARSGEGADAPARDASGQVHVSRSVACVFLVCLAIGAAACSQDTATRRHIENGDRFLQSGKPQQAIIEFRSALDGNEKWGEARFKLAQAYAAIGDAEHAYREYIRAADLMPDNMPAQLKAATYLLLARQYQDARSRVERVLDKEPKNRDALIILGNALAGLNDLDGAVEQINEAIALEPDRSQTYTNLAMLKIAQGQRDEAQAAFEKAVETDPTSGPAWLALGNFQWSSGDVAAAEQSFTRAFERGRDDVLTNRALAAFYVATGRNAEAEQHLKLAAQKAPIPATQFALADYYISSGRPDDARRILEPLAAATGTAADAETRLAGLAYTAGRTAEAHRRLNTLIAHDRNNSGALLLQARWLLSEGKRTQALARARAAVTADPRLAVAYYVRGLAEAGSRRTSDAIKSFGEVLRLNPRAAIAQVQLSRLHLARNPVRASNTWLVLCCVVFFFFFYFVTVGIVSGSAWPSHRTILFELFYLWFHSPAAGSAADLPRRCLLPHRPVLRGTHPFYQLVLLNLIMLLFLDPERVPGVLRRIDAALLEPGPERERPRAGLAAGITPAGRRPARWWAERTPAGPWPAPAASNRSRETCASMLLPALKQVELEVAPAGPNARTWRTTAASEEAPKGAPSSTS